MKKATRLISFIMTIVLMMSLGYTSFASAETTSDSITVTYDLQEGTLVSGSTTEIVTPDGTYSAMPTVSRAGYAFAGWYTGSGGSGVPVDQGNSMQSPGDHTLYAKWEPNYYNITCDAQGGDTEVEKYTVNIRFGSPYSLPSITPTRTHYTFGGWWTEPNGAGTEVTTNTQMTIPADHKLYAKWIPDTYTVTFYFHDGSHLSEYDRKIVSYGEPYGTLPEPERDTYIFDGWYTSTYGGGTKVIDTTQVTRASDHSLYTNWTRPKVAVTFDVQDGKGTTFTRNLTYGDTYHILDWPQRDGYTMYGWYTEPDGGGIEHDVFTLISTPHAYTLYAKWVPKTYTVYLEAQGGGGVAASLTRQFDSAYRPLPIPTRQNYIFEGWYTASGNKGTLVTDDTIVSTAYDHTLYARWAGNPYTVTLDPQGGDVTTATLSLRHGSSYEDLPTPSRAHYIFEGWYTAPDDSGVLITSDTKVTATDDHILYARWTQASITITLDPQGGEVSTTVIYRNLGDKYALPEPTRTGYEFFAWGVTPGLGGKYYYENAIVEDPNDHTLYARWVGIVYTITFDTQGGTLTSGSTTKYVSYGKTYDSPYAVKENYAFGGWWTEPYGKGTQIHSNMKPTANQTLYAYWTYDYGPSLPPAPVYIPPPTLPPAYMPMPPITPGFSDHSAYIEPPEPYLPPMPTLPSFTGITPSFVVTGSMPDGSERVLPGNYNSDTGRFSFLYDKLPKNLGDSTIMTGYSTAAPSGISEDHWACQDTSMLISQGVLDGSKPVVPDTSMTREDLVAMLYRTVAFPLNPTGDPTFSDTEGDDTAINWAAEKGIITGLPDGTFRPDAEITRQEAFVVLVRFLETYGIEPPETGTGDAPREFSDTKDIADWAFGSLKTLMRYGLVHGTPGDDGPEINPLSNISVAELITLISRVMRII